MTRRIDCPRCHETVAPVVRPANPLEAGPTLWFLMGGLMGLACYHWWRAQERETCPCCDATLSGPPARRPARPIRWKWWDDENEAAQRSPSRRPSSAA